MLQILNAGQSSPILLLLFNLAIQFWFDLKDDFYF